METVEGRISAKESLARAIDDFVQAKKTHPNLGIRIDVSDESGKITGSLSLKQAKKLLRETPDNNTFSITLVP